MQRDGCWGLTLEKTVYANAISHSIHAFSPSLLLTCDIFIVLMEEIFFFFEVVFLQFLPSNDQKMSWNIGYRCFSPILTLSMNIMVCSTQTTVAINVHVDCWVLLWEVFIACCLLSWLPILLCGIVVELHLNHWHKSYVKTFFLMWFQTPLWISNRSKRDTVYEQIFPLTNFCASVINTLSSDVLKMWISHNFNLPSAKTMFVD